MVYSYIRQLHGLNSLAEQQRDILSFSLANHIQIDKEVVEYSNRPLKIEERKEFEEFLHALREGDSIVVPTLSILSQYADELIKLINCSLSKEVTLYVVSPKRVINKTTKIIDLFPLINDLREAEASKNTQIGRPKGSRSSSKFDQFKAQIMKGLKEGMSVSAMARELEVSRSSLKDYIESRKLRELVDGAWLEKDFSDKKKESEDRVLICPLEKIH